jgi:hypothetical protein
MSRNPGIRGYRGYKWTAAAGPSPPRPALKETPFVSEDNRRGVLLDMSPQVRRLSIPKVVQIRYAAKTGKYKLGNGWVRDPVRV